MLGLRSLEVYNSVFNKKIDLQYIRLLVWKIVKLLQLKKNRRTKKNTENRLTRPRSI